MMFMKKIATLLFALLVVFLLGTSASVFAANCDASGDPWSCYEPTPRPVPPPAPPAPTPRPTPTPTPTPTPAPTTTTTTGTTTSAPSNSDFFQTNEPPIAVKDEIKKAEKALSNTVVGVGDNCKAGTRVPDWYAIPAGTIIATDIDLEKIFVDMAERDLRLRRVMWKGDELTFMYLQPAYRFGFVPMNYYLTVTASASTMRLDYSTPGWVSGAETQQEYIEKAFRENTSKYLSSEYLTTLATADILTRQAALAQAVAQIMYTAPVMPISNNFFVCSILPILAYVVLVALFVFGFLFFIIRKLAIKKNTNNFLQHLHAASPDNGGFQVRSPSTATGPKPFMGTPSIEPSRGEPVQHTQHAPAVSSEKIQITVPSQVSDPGERQKLDDLYQKRIAELKARQAEKSGKAHTNGEDE